MLKIYFDFPILRASGFHLWQNHLTNHDQRTDMFAKEQHTLANSTFPVAPSCGCDIHTTNWFRKMVVILSGRSWFNNAATPTSTDTSPAFGRGKPG
jgi:hypothetical protein